MNGLSASKKILILAPHTDDGEIGCGGSIRRFIKDGHDIVHHAFSTTTKGVDDQQKFIAEFNRANLALAVNFHVVHDYPMREFSSARQELLDALLDIKKRIQPDVVILPSTFDTHQDHQVLSQEGFRAFKDCSILGYEMPWNNLTFNTTCFVRLEQEDIDAKWNAMSYYESCHHYPYFKEDLIYGLARTRGVQAGCEFAEAFEVIRWIV